MNTPLLRCPVGRCRRDGAAADLGELTCSPLPQLDRVLAALHTRNCELDLAEVPFTDSTE
ncbi:hypothetical protein [Streptomyces sp. KL116D]|uniref:hypothetical protein n=1 Tax=Streptomyces sp. KL116D TaxID=3045152 RepID=UPI0035578E65